MTLMVKLCINNAVCIIPRPIDFGGKLLSITPRAIFGLFSVVVI